MATQPTPYRSMSDVDRELAAMSQSLDQLVHSVEAMQQSATEHMALVNVAVVMTEAHEYAEHTRQDADQYAQQTRAQAETDAAAQRHATTVACQEAETSARATVDQLYREAGEALTRLQTDYATRRTALTQVQSDTREAWTLYKTHLAAAYEAVDQALQEPPPTLPALDTLAMLAAPVAAPRPFAEDPPSLADPVVSAETAPTMSSGSVLIDSDPVVPVAADLATSSLAADELAAPAAPSEDLRSDPETALSLTAEDPPLLPETTPHLIADPLAVGALGAAAAPSGDARPVMVTPAPTPSAPEEEAPALSPLDRPLPSFGAGLARPLVLRDQPLPTIAEPARGR